MYSIIRYPVRLTNCNLCHIAIVVYLVAVGVADHGKGLFCTILPGRTGAAVTD